MYAKLADFDIVSIRGYTSQGRSRSAAGTMRLLNTSTLELKSFPGMQKPAYAILSHTWESEDEFLFEDLTARQKKTINPNRDTPK